MSLHDDWQNIDSIIESNRMMLEKQQACDVTFLLGKDGDSLGAHMFVLISRSPVFDVMFSGPMNQSRESNNIVMPDIEIGPFKSLLEYLYTGHTDISADTVIPLLYAAKKYSVVGLSNKCLSFVENNLDAQNACNVLEQAHFFDETDFQERVLQVILRKAEEVLETEDFSELCMKCLSMIIGSDNLIANENVVLKACKRWAKSECNRRDLEMTDDNCRIMLGPALYLIRFPLMESVEFVKEIASGKLLSDKEKVDVMGRYIVPSRPSAFFCAVARKKNRHHQFNRFKTRSPVPFNNKSGCNAIAFKTSKDVIMEGFTIYGTCRPGEQDLQVYGRILDPSDDIICSVETTITTNGTTEIYEVIFDESCRIQRSVRYTIKVDISGSHTFAGEDGRLTAFAGDTIFTFIHSDSSLTGTTVGHGQLPGLTFSL